MEFFNLDGSAQRPPRSVGARTLKRQHLCLSPKVCVPISVGVSDPRGEEEGREIVAKIVHRFLKTSRPLKATERLERAVNLDKSE